MALAQDGTTITAIGHGVSSLAATISTAGTDRIIIVLSAQERTAAQSTFASVSSITDTAGLTWALRKQLQWSPSVGNAARQDLEIWWARAPAQLTADAITVNFANADDNGCIAVFAVSGSLQPATPWSTDASLPASATNVTGSTVATQVTGVSTPNAGDFAIACASNAQNQHYSSTTATWTTICNLTEGAGSLFEDLGAMFKIGALSAATVAMGTTSSNWGMIVDALTSASANSAPVLANTSAISYLDHDPAAAINTALTVTDSDSANMASATVSIITNFHSAEDSLIFANQNGITGSYNSSTGVLSLSGSATKAFYQTALRSVQYLNSSGTPTNATRTVRFVVNDGSLNSNNLDSTVAVATVTTSIHDFSTPGSDSFTVTNYHAMDIEIWAGGSSGDAYAATASVKGNHGSLSSIASLGLTANPAATSTGNLQFAVPGAAGSAIGGQLNILGQIGGYGGKELGALAIPASADQGGDAPFGGLGGQAHSSGGIGGAHAGFDGTWPGGGGSATRLVGFLLAFGGWYTLHAAGGTSGSYVKMRYVRGLTGGAPNIGDVLALTIGAGGAAVSGASVNSGKGADGGIRITIQGFADLSFYEGGSGSSAPTDLGTGTVTVSGADYKAGTALFATYDGDDPDSSTGSATGRVWQWKRDGGTISGASGTTYKLAAADVGHVITATLVYTDAKGFRDSATSAATPTILPKPMPLDQFVSGEVYAAYGLRQLRTAYTGALFRLRSGASGNPTLDVFPAADGYVDWAAVATWKTAQGTEFEASRYAKWYNQMADATKDLDGLSQTVSNCPEFAPANGSQNVLPNGFPATVKFNGNEEFVANDIAGPSSNLGFLAVIEREGGLPGDIFRWNYPGAENTDNAGFFIAQSAVNDWSNNAAVFIGHGLATGRSPRAIANIAEETANTDAHIWDGELNTSGVGLRKDGSNLTLDVSVRSTFTAPPALISGQGALRVGPRIFDTGENANIIELTIFNLDVHSVLQPYRASAAEDFLLGSITSPAASDLHVDFTDDGGLSATPSLALTFAANFTDDNGLTATISIVPALQVNFTDEAGLTATPSIVIKDRPPASQMAVVCIGL